MYSPTVKDHFSNPRNVGDLENPDATGMAKNKSDGDQVQIQLAVADGIIRDVRIRVMGCVAAIAASSCFSEMIKGMPVDEALKITRDQLAARLGGLPEQKIQCSLTCIDALKDALSR
jgi:nitrogen fixation NifU-like protein